MSRRVIFLDGNQQSLHPEEFRPRSEGTGGGDDRAGLLFEYLDAYNFL